MKVITGKTGKNSSVHNIQALWHIEFKEKALCEEIELIRRLQVEKINILI